jgi:gas vesicle protein
MKNGKFLAGTIAGLGAGAILGILFAPAKGSVLRKRIMKLTCSSDEEHKVNIHEVMRKNKEHLQQREEVL